jgi:hypothetical protein
MDTKMDSKKDPQSHRIMETIWAQQMDPTARINKIHNKCWTKSLHKIVF